MKSILLIIFSHKVCEEYRIHRETYYLSVDLYDRFMDTQINILKEQLQLIGVTCLFIASKIEVHNDLLSVLIYSSFPY